MVDNPISFLSHIEQAPYKDKHSNKSISSKKNHLPQGTSSIFEPNESNGSIGW